MAKHTTLILMSVACLSLMGCGALNQLANPPKDGQSNATAKPNDQQAEVVQPEAAPEPEAPEPEPNPELRKTLLKCNAEVKPKDVQSGVVGPYKFTEGMKTEERTGFLERQPLEMSEGCFLGELSPSQCVSWTVDEKKYAALGNSNEWEVQCVYSDDPSAGVIRNKNEFPYKMETLNPYYFMLMCGHDQGDSYECMQGSNSIRGGKWRDKLKAQGKLQMGFCAPKSVMYQEVAYDYKKFPKGRWIYCQYFNKKTAQSMVGFEFKQVVTGR